METQARKLYSGSSEQGLFSLKEQFDNDGGDGDVKDVFSDVSRLILRL